MKDVILIPALNPDERLINLVKSIIKDGKDYIADIVVVDDGSQERYQYVFRRLESIGVRVIHHRLNMGKGASIKAGLTLLQERMPYIDGYITADADGKYNSVDIISVARCMEENPEQIIVAERDLDRFNASKKYKLTSRMTSWCLKKTTGVKCDDVKSGLRGIPASLNHMAITTQGNRHDYDRNFIFQAARSGVGIVNIPVHDCPSQDLSTSC